MQKCTKKSQNMQEKNLNMQNKISIFLFDYNLAVIGKLFINFIKILKNKK
jgi:hypothetical protein